MVLAVVEHGPASIRKPPEPVRGVASRLPWVWDSLCFAVPFNDATRDSARDLVNNVAPSATVGLVWSRDNRGDPAASLGTGSYIEYADTPSHNRPTTAVSMHVRLQRLGATDASGGVFCTHPCSIFMDDFTTNAVQAELLLSDGTFGNIRADYVLPTNLWVSIFVRWRSGAAPQLFMLGERGNILVSYTYVPMTGTLSNPAGDPFRINSFANDATVNSNAAYSQVMMWSRWLSDTELQSLVADPYGWYSPKRETVILSGPVPIVWATTFRAYGYAMFATATERDALQAEVQAWLDAHTAQDVWASEFTIQTPAGDYALPAGIATPDLMDDADPQGGPWPGLTWSYQVATKELRDSFGSVPGLGAVWSGGALEGSQFGESTS